MEYIALFLNTMKQMRHRPASVYDYVFATVRFFRQWHQRLLMEAFIGRV